MTNPSSISSSNTTDSVRYQRLVEVLHLALKKSRSQLDVEEVVKECYGNDNVAVFQPLLEGVLEQAQSEVTTSTLAHCTSSQVDVKLQRLDSAIRTLDRETVARQRQMERDKASAEAALAQAQLPEGVTAQDWVQYQAYQRLMEEKKALEEEIAAEEAAVAELEAAQQQQASTTGKGVEEMQAFKEKLEKSADLCSTVH